MGAQSCLVLFWSKSMTMFQYCEDSPLLDAWILSSPFLEGLSERSRSSLPRSIQDCRPGHRLHNPRNPEARSPDWVLGRSPLPTRGGSKWGADEAQQGTSKNPSPNLCPLAAGECGPCPQQMQALPPQRREPKWAESTLCPSKQKSRQKSEEVGTDSETRGNPLWEPGNLIKAPTGPEIWLSFPDFFPWLDTRKRAAGLRCWKHEWNISSFLFSYHPPCTAPTPSEHHEVF